MDVSNGPSLRKPWRRASVSRPSRHWRPRFSLAAKITMRCSKRRTSKNEITNWLMWFAGVAIEAQRRTIALVDFLIDKTRLLDRLKGQLNERQERALLHIFREGPEGFRGGLTAGKYSSGTGASPATTTRDLTDLAAKGALVREGERRHAHYHLAVPLRPVPYERCELEQG